MRSKRRLYAGSGFIAKKILEENEDLTPKDLELKVDGESIDVEQALADYEALQSAIYDLAHLESRPVPPDREDYRTEAGYKAAFEKYEEKVERHALKLAAPERENYESDEDFERAMLIHKRLATRRRLIKMAINAVPSAIASIKKEASITPPLSMNEKMILARGEDLPLFPDLENLVAVMRHGAASTMVDGTKEAGKRLHQLKELVVVAGKKTMDARHHPLVATPTAFVVENAQRLLDTPVGQPVKLAGQFVADVAPVPIDIGKELLFRTHPHKVAASHVVEVSLPDGQQKFARVSVTDPGIELSILKEVMGAKIASIPPFVPFSGIPLCAALGVRFHQLARSAYHEGNIPEAKAYERARDDLMVYAVVGATWVLGEGLYSASATQHGVRASSVKDEDFVSFEWLPKLPELQEVNKPRKPRTILRGLMASFSVAGRAAVQKVKKRRRARVLYLESLALAARDPNAALQLLRETVETGVADGNEAKTLMALAEKAAANGLGAVADVYRRTAVLAIEESQSAETVAASLEKALEALEAGEAPDEKTIKNAHDVAEHQLEDVQDHPIEKALAQATVEATENEPKEPKTK